MTTNRVLWSVESDHHSDILAEAGLVDGPLPRAWVRVEITPATTPDSWETYQGDWTAVIDDELCRVSSSLEDARGGLEGILAAARARLADWQATRGVALDRIKAEAEAERRAYAERMRIYAAEREAEAERYAAELAARRASVAAAIACLVQAEALEPFPRERFTRYLAAAILRGEKTYSPSGVLVDDEDEALGWLAAASESRLAWRLTPGERSLELATEALAAASGVAVYLSPRASLYVDALGYVAELEPLDIGDVLEGLGGESVDSVLDRLADNKDSELEGEAVVDYLHDTLSDELCCDWLLDEVLDSVDAPASVVEAVRASNEGSRAFRRGLCEASSLSDSGDVRLNRYYGDWSTYDCPPVDYVWEQMTAGTVLEGLEVDRAPSGLLASRNYGEPSYGQWELEGSVYVDEALYVSDEDARGALAAGLCAAIRESAKRGRSAAV
jgi:hypothetical protein